MEFFYKNWKKGMSKPEALRQAQITLKAIPQYKHPFYWAPFVMIGDWKEEEPLTTATDTKDQKKGKAKQNQKERKKIKEESRRLEEEKAQLEKDRIEQEKLEEERRELAEKKAKLEAERKEAEERKKQAGEERRLEAERQKNEKYSFSQSTNQIVVPDKLQVDTLEFDNTEDYLKKHWPGLSDDASKRRESDDTIKSTAKLIWDSNSNRTICISNKRQRSYYLIVKTENGIRKAALLNRYSGGNVILPLDVFLGTAVPNLQINEEAALKNYFTKVSQEIAKNGKCVALALSNGKYSWEIHYEVNEKNPVFIDYNLNKLETANTTQEKYAVLINNVDGVTTTKRGDKLRKPIIE
jgi:hypothetical protein